MKNLMLLVLLLPALVYSLTYTDVVIPGRVVNGSLVSDYDEDAEVPIFGNVQGSGSTTIIWSPVAVDTNGDPVEIYMYELRFRLVGSVPYTAITVPGQFTGHSLTLADGNYEGYVEAFDGNGDSSTAAELTFSVP